MGFSFPLHEEHVNRFCGMPVCIITHDGSRHVGILSRCEGGRVYLNERPDQVLSTSAELQSGLLNVPHISKKKGKSTKLKTKAAIPQTAKAQVKAFGPYGYGYGYNPFVESFIDLSLIAFLFLLI